MACRDPAARRETVEHAPSRSLAHPATAAVGLTSTVPVAVGATTTREAQQAVDKLGGEPIAKAVARAIARKELPGCVVAVGNRETLLYLQAFGERTAGEPMTLDTRFDLASLTKAVATARA